MRKSSSTNDLLDDLERSRAGVSTNNNNNAAQIKQQQQQQRQQHQININKPNMTQQQQQLKINNSRPMNNTKASNSSGISSNVNNNALINRNLLSKVDNDNKNAYSAGNDRLVKNTAAVNLANKNPSPAKVNAQKNTTTTTTPKAVNLDELYSVVDKSSVSKLNTAAVAKTTTKHQQGTKQDGGKVAADSVYTNIETIQPTKNIVTSGNIYNSSSSSGANVTAPATKVVQKPPAPTLDGIGVERNRSSVKKGIMEDKKKASLEKSNCKFIVFFSCFYYFFWMNILQ